MTKPSQLLLLTGSFTLVIFFLFLQNSTLSVSHHAAKINEEQKGITKPALLAMQAGYQFMKLKDPKTGAIPPGIRTRELAFASGLPAYPDSDGQAWDWRGPANIGGRMLCIAIDMDDENHLLAGSLYLQQGQRFRAGHAAIDRLPAQFGELR
ncbi:MAG: hypothetical protein WCI05_02995 [Myxococcales bacterium]